MNKLIRTVIYFAVLTSFLAAQIFTYDLGAFQLSLFRAAILLLPVLVCVYALRSTEPVYLLAAGKKNSYSVRFMLLWLLYAVVSVLMNPVFSSWLRNIYFLGCGVLCALLFGIFLTEKGHIITVFRLMRLMIAVQMFIGWYEIIFRRYHFINAFNQAYYSSAAHRIPIAMCGNPNDFAMLMLFGVFIGYVCFCCRKGLADGIFSVALMANCAFFVFQTESRANIIGLLMAAAFFVLVSYRNRVGVLLGVVCAAAGLSLVIPGLWEKVGLELSNTLTFDFSGQYMGSDTIRVNLIKNGFYFLYQTFGLGTGAGNLEYWMQNAAIYPTGGITNMHNWWMELLTSYGIIVFIGYGIFYVKLFRDFYRTLKQSADPQIRAIAFGFLCCMVGFLVGSVSSSSNIKTEWLWVFWAVAIAFQGQLSTPCVLSPAKQRLITSRYIKGVIKE